MSRFISLRMLGHLFVAVALLVSLEGVSYARTTTQPLRAAIEAPAPLPESESASNGASSGEAPTIQSTIGDEVARIHICHISKHPRDGVPATERACPLIIAEAEVVAPALGVALPN